MADQDPTAIGRVLVTLGYCTATEVSAGLQQVNGASLGETLVSTGIVTKHQLAWALDYQRLERGETSPVEVLRSHRKALVDDLGDLSRNTHATAARLHGKLG